MKLRLALTGGIGLSTIAYIGLLVVDRTDGTLRERLIDRTIVLYLVAFVGFALVAWRNGNQPLDKRWLWLIPIGFRIVLALTTPTLSDDVYRYQWDGHLVAEGVNPYAYPILASELDGYTTEARTLANNPELSSPYLPVAHGVFALTDIALPDSPHAMQLVMIVFDLVVALGLVRLLRTVGLGEHRVLLYLWNPFVIVEVAHGAHLDAIMVAWQFGRSLSRCDLLGPTSSDLSPPLPRRSCSRSLPSPVHSRCCCCQCCGGAGRCASSQRSAWSALG